MGEDQALCPHCGMRPVDVPEAGVVRQRFIEKERALRAALVGERTEGPPRALAGEHYEDLPQTEGGPLRGKTWLFLGLLVICVGGAVACGFVAEVPRIYWKLASMLAALIAVPACIFFSQDTKVPAPRGRTAPEAGLRAFMSALITERYRYAHGCLVPGERDGRIRRQPEIEDFGLFGRHYEFNRLDGFRRYWRALVKPSNRSVPQWSIVTVASFEVTDRDGDFAVVSCGLSIALWDWRIDEERHPLLKVCRYSGVLMWVPWLINICTPRTLGLHLKKLVRRIDDQWYVVNGELYSREDAALAEVVEVAALSDRELQVGSED